MQIAPSTLHAMPIDTRLTSDPSTGVKHYSDLISTRDAATDRLPKPVDDEAHEAARSLVSITLIGPLLAQARQDPFGSELFHGGFAEEAFGAQLDSILAERITQRSRLPIVESVYERMTTTGRRVNTLG